MAYQKRNFKPGDLLKATDLNAMDAQIAKNEETAEEAKSAAGGADEAIKKALKFVRTLTSEDDLNNIRQSGIYDYYLSGIPKNTPFNENVSAVLICVISGESGQPTLQLAAGENEMKYRCNHSASTSAWGEWKSTESAEIKIAQGTGTGTDVVMSQDAVTKMFSSADENARNAVIYAGEALGAAVEAKRLAESLVNETLSWKRYLEGTDDIDTITESGIYVILNSDLPMNMPIQRSAVMLVYGSDIVTVQTLVEDLTSNEVRRIRFGQIGWSNWNYQYEVVHSTGERDDAVMSQKATTGALNLLYESLSGQGGSGDSGDSADDYSSVILAMSLMMTSGVFVSDDADAMKPSPGDGLKVVSNKGTVLIKGYCKNFRGKETRSFLSGTSDRTEVRIIRLTESTGEIEVIWRDVIMYGDMMISKQDGLELPIRSNGIYDLVTVKVTVPANATVMTEDMIEDLRANEKYCGHVRCKLN